MKNIILIITVLFFAQKEVMAQTKFVLEPTQSMLMTGKGPGQDATLNPFSGEDCYAIVKNIGQRSFKIRIQQKGEIIEEIKIAKGELKKVELLKGYELYLDPNPEGITRASVDYKKRSE